MNNELKQKWNDFWQARSSQEQNMLTLCAAVVLLALVYLIGIAPALSGRAKLKNDLPNLRLQAAQLQSLTQEAQALAGRAGPPPEPMRKESVAKLLDMRGMTPKTIGMVGEQVKVQLDGVPFASLVTWLDEIQKTAHITVVDAQIVGQPSVGMVNATLSLQQAKTE